jgi:hypothetical protein
VGVPTPSALFQMTSEGLGFGPPRVATRPWSRSLSPGEGLRAVVWRCPRARSDSGRLRAVIHHDPLSLDVAGDRHADADGAALTSELVAVFTLNKPQTVTSEHDTRSMAFGGFFCHMPSRTQTSASPTATEVTAFFFCNHEPICQTDDQRTRVSRDPPPPVRFP